MSQASVDLEAIKRHLDRELAAYLRELELLVNVDSGTFDKEGVDLVGSMLRRRYRAMHAHIVEYPSDTRGDSFVASWEGDGPGSVMLVGHLDTAHTNPREIAELMPGEMATLICEVRGSALLRTRKMPIFEMTVGDLGDNEPPVFGKRKRNTIKCIWFNARYMDGR